MVAVFRRGTMFYNTSDSRSVGIQTCSLSYNNFKETSRIPSRVSSSQVDTIGPKIRQLEGPL